ncbi:HUWE1 ligase, partial [Amia calva]|nr:HUWE1 ligase [Amia calva]
MKVDRSKLKKTPTEAPADCRTLIDRLKGCSDEQLLLELQQIKTWNIGKCELYHWVDLLDRFDGILCDAGQTVESMSWMLVCDRPDNGQLKSLLLAVLNFTALLIEYSFSRHLYSSIEHLTTLLASCDMQVVLAVLNLLYVFSKRSNYITRLGSDKRAPLLARLQHLAESWGGKENGFGLAECCRDLPMAKYPPSATTLHFEFYAEPGAEVKVDRKSTSNTLHYIHIEQLDKISESPSEIMESLTMMYSIPKDKQILLFTHIRLAHGFSNHKKRLQAVQARLHAISILVYSNALQESANSILYNGLIEELVDVLQITDKQLVDIKAASLRTLTSIVHLERTPKLSNIIDCTGTASYHGFLPVLVRNCIQAMIDPLMEPYPHQFATALFSFLYHLASYDAGGEALVSCGMMEALLKVIKFLGDEQDQITFVTRAVRVVDLITNLDMAAFQAHSGLTIFICRLEHEVDLCRKECPFVIKPKIQRASAAPDTEDMETDMEGQSLSLLPPPFFSLSLSLKCLCKEIVGTEERIPIPLMDYILNVMKFVESILSNNTTDDHCQEFVSQKGLLPLVSILGLPNLPIDFPTSAACQAVAGVCKSILTLSHEPKVLQEGLCQLEGILSSLEPHATPLLHALTAAHAYIMMFVHTCRVGQSEIRAISVNQWGSQLGLSVLNKLSQLYCSLVWESTVLLSLCTPNSLPPGCEFGQADMQKLVPKEERTPGATGVRRPADGDVEAVAGSSVDPSGQVLLEGMGLDGDTLAPMETDEPSASDTKSKSKLTPAMAARIKQIKPLLSGECVCVSLPLPPPLLSALLAVCVSPSWQQCPPPYTPTPRFRLTFFICSVGFTSPMLFDERKYPYHLMLQKFFCSGGHDALFETFNWALSMGGRVPVSEGLEHPDLPDGTGEFLDAWLMLVEKMVNPTTVLDSPHALPAKLPGATPSAPHFSALRFLIVTQKAAFSCIRSLWNRRPLKVYGGRMAESMLAILCHILRGETPIRERLSKEREGGRPAEEEGAPPAEEGGGTAPRREPQVNQQQLQQKGYTIDTHAHRPTHSHTTLTHRHRQHCTVHTRGAGRPGCVVIVCVCVCVVQDLSMSEEDQMMRAIAMSLGQEVSMEQRSDSPEVTLAHPAHAHAHTLSHCHRLTLRCLERFLEAEPLEAGELHAFTDAMLPGCFHLLDELPDTVYRVCDLVMTAVKRNGPEYRDMILRQVVNQVWEAADVLIKAALPLTTSDTKTVSEWTSQMATLPQASNLATRILLLTLLFEELKLSCARVVESSGILTVLIKLLEVVQPCLQAAKEHKDVQTPKWITPVLLLIDFYEKTAVSSKRRAQMTKYLQPNGNSWRWFDDRSGRWCSYSASNNSTIDTAWRAGESSVRFTAGRRRYTVQFNTMVQVNEETGNRRPVMLTVQRVPRVAKSSRNGAAELDRAEESKEPTGKSEDPHTDAGNTAVHAHLRSHNTGNTPARHKHVARTHTGNTCSPHTRMTTVLIRACVSMISVPVDPDTLHATLRLCLRLTRTHHFAMMFAELRSTRMILALTQGSGFNGFTPLVTLLFRHIIEDPATLRHTMEKVVRSAVTSGAGSTTSGVVSGSLGSRIVTCAWHVRSRITVNPTLALTLSPRLPASLASDDEFENLRIKGPNAVQLVKTTPLKLSPLPAIPEPIKEVIYDMLNALAAYHAPEEVERAEGRPGTMSSSLELCQVLQDVGDDVYQHYRLTRQGSDFDSQTAFNINSQVFSADGSAAESSQSGTPQGEASTPEEVREGKKEQEGERGGTEDQRGKAKASKPLMPTSTILRLLAELVRSYVGIATLIASYCYTAGQSELIKEDCSVLAFVLDHLLPHTQSSEDKDTPALARLFLASLAVENELVDLIDELLERDAGTVNSTIIVGRSGEDESQEDVLMDEAPSNLSQASTLQANREGTLRQLTANTGHTIHVHYPGNRQPNPPLILQRLLGPSAAADILQLSSSLPLQSRGRARLLVGNDDVHIIARSDDELLDDFFHEQSSTGGQAGTLSSIPTALTRWSDECKVLDAESMHDCVAVVKVPILQQLEVLRDEELEERREKRRRQLAEEEEAKQNEKSAGAPEEGREQSLQVREGEMGEDGEGEELGRAQCRTEVLWGEVVVCIVLGSHPILEITIHPTVFPTVTARRRTRDIGQFADGQEPGAQPPRTIGTLVGRRWCLCDGLWRGEVVSCVVVGDWDVRPLLEITIQLTAFPAAAAYTAPPTGWESNCCHHTHSLSLSLALSLSLSLRSVMVVLLPCGSTVHIHPQAAPVVCRHVLDTLIQLAKCLCHAMPCRTRPRAFSVKPGHCEVCPSYGRSRATVGLVLTSHSCSEEGLEDAANILLQLSRGDAATRDTVLRLLLSGASQLGYTLCKQIGTLLAELREYNLEQQRRAQADALSPDAPDDAPHSTRPKGKMTSRFDTAENVVIVATQKRTLGGRELQLPSMGSLTSKTSTQKFFLRVLQVIIQLREDTRRANKKAKQTGRLGSSSLYSAVQYSVIYCIVQCSVIYCMVQHSVIYLVSEPPPAQRDDSPMDVDQPSPLGQEPPSLAGEGSSQSEREEKGAELPLLSDELQLDELWDMLGECLKELEESHDQHAVLVLQPAVEAFFLVHATERESKPPVRDTRESQLSHIKDEPPPLSPAPLTPATPSSSSSSSLDPFFSREPSSMHISANLPPDTQKFLRFAGECKTGSSDGRAGDTHLHTHAHCC